MNYPLLIALLLACCVNVTAQTVENDSDLDQRFVICLGAGPALPLGKFESDDFSDEESGLALTGFNLLAYANLKVDNKVGLLAQYTFIKNKVNEEAFPPGLQVYDEWELQTFLGGLSYNARGSKANVDIKLMVGYLLAKTPALSYYLNLVVDDVFVFQERAETGALAYGAGLNFRYRLGEHLGFFVNADYILSEPSFDVNYRFEDNSVLTIGGLTQPIEMVNVTGGLAFRF